MDTGDYGRACKAREWCGLGTLLPLFGEGGAKYTEVAQVISVECGEPVVSQTVGRWVRGERAPTLPHALALYHVVSAKLATLVPVGGDAA